VYGKFIVIFIKIIGQGDQKVHSITNDFPVIKSSDDICLLVQPITFGGFGVYADTVLIAIHTDEASADAHCLRLRNQQAGD
jgi:hypothetical protein